MDIPKPNLAKADSRLDQAHNLKKVIHILDLDPSWGVCYRVVHYNYGRCDHGFRQGCVWIKGVGTGDEA